MCGWAGCGEAAVGDLDGVAGVFGDVFDVEDDAGDRGCHGVNIGIPAEKVF